MGYFFMISHNLIIKTKIISFEFQILQRLLNTNFRLFIFKIYNTKLQSLYHKTKESKSHLLFECLHTRNIWIQKHDDDRLNNFCDINMYLRNTPISLSMTYFPQIQSKPIYRTFSIFAFFKPLQISDKNKENILSREASERNDIEFYFIYCLITYEKR